MIQKVLNFKENNIFRLSEADFLNFFVKFYIY